MVRTVYLLPVQLVISGTTIDVRRMWAIVLLAHTGTVIHVVRLLIDVLRERDGMVLCV